MDSPAARQLALGLAATLTAAGCNAIMGFDRGQSSEPSAGAGGQTTTSSGTGGTAGGAGAGGNGGTGLGPIEQPCGAPGECPVGYHCVDGYCCTTPCVGLCEACDVAGHLGECAPVPPATDPDEECVDDGICDGSGACARGNTLFSLWFGDAADDQRAEDVSIDGAGNVYVTGSFRGDVWFGGETFVAGDNPDGFIVKFNTHGQHLWSHAYGGDGTSPACVGRGVAVDDDRVLLVGNAGNGVSFGCSSHFASALFTDLFFAMLGGNDTCAWSQVHGVFTHWQYARKVAFDPQGNALVVGSYFGSPNLGTPPLPSAEGEDAFLVKLTADGTYVWGHSFGESAEQRAVAVAARGDTVAVAGWFEGDVDFGDGMVSSAGGFDGFVALFDDDGDLLWRKQLGDGQDQRAYGVALDGAGNVVVVGEFDGAITLDGETITSAGGSDLFLVKLDANGDLLFSAAFGDGSFQQARDVAVDSSNHIVVVGNGRGAFGLGGQSYQPLGNIDVVIAKYTPDGTHLWSYRYGGAGDQIVRAVDVGEDDAIVLVGNYTGPSNFGGATLLPYGAEDIFVVKLAP
ncbi:MAG: hypothetical protein JRI55_20280 [Deltaproteobacteria bacterium]|jgi:hypothetical protein|nr:hypothetical protein [Deltaproteobacteria bacterium]